MPIALKRVYEAPARSDGFRVLVERLWPRGLSKQRAHVDLWLKDAAPSPELRRWFAHDPDKWSAFKKKYFAELRAAPRALDPLRAHGLDRRITFVYASREERYNNAVALREFLQRNASS